MTHPPMTIEQKVEVGEEMNSSASQYPTTSEPREDAIDQSGVAELPALIRKIAQVAHAVGWQAGVGATELAGLMVSVMAAQPDQIGRFMAEGSELFLDGTFRAEEGCLTYFAENGNLMSPVELRKIKGVEQ